MSEQKPEYIDFIDFTKTIIDNTVKEKTASWYQCSIDSFKKFWKSDKINACDITANRMREYKETLEKNGMQPGGINNYMRGIRSLFNKCKDHYNKEDYDIILIPNKPFKNVDIPEYRRRKKNIPIETVKRIRDGKFDTERENIARDMFMMMFYLMGINVNDLFNLSGPRYGRIEYERSKTNTDGNTSMFPLSIKVEPELKELIDKYSSGYFLSDIKTRYTCSYNFMKAINQGLEKISTEFNIPKITTNWARHSWASIARNKAKVPKADVDFCLGHVNNDYKMADIYIDIDYEICDDANRKVLNLLRD
ncbi:tyrosine-type recombinase/integrase [Proteiniphilum acetatigenes]|uniref:tyrosine-type recombinase/integrase n=1 Tax=Proteiniphilum acetatigenes TaxID=294710 RepID=UPI001FE124DA|nr:phage integrase SAM-like domain-containing protein [Proteiniphilum acetatigenes]